MLLQKLLAGYVELIRGTPLMLQLFVLFYLCPRSGSRSIRWSPASPGWRSTIRPTRRRSTARGCKPIPAGQMEAALALGMSRTMALRRVIIPQAVRIVIPPVTNDFIALFKDTSVCSVITLTELTKQYSILANSTGGAIEFALAVAALYMMMSVPLVVVLAMVRAPAGRRRRERRGTGMIEVIDLVKWHGAIEVLRGVSLSVARGEVAAIIGPSGSGKSTFLRCLNGLKPFQSGCVTIDGLRFEPAGRSRDWPAIHRQVCLRVGMVFQSFNLFPHRTALQNVMEAPIYVLGLSRAAAEERARGCWTGSGCRTG